MNLPLVRSKKTDSHLNSENLSKCFNLLSNIELVNYFEQQFEKLKFSEEVSQSVKEYVKIVKNMNLPNKNRDIQNNIWDGNAIVDNKFNKYYANTAEELSTIFNKQTKEIDMQFAMNDDAEFLRGYVQENDELTEEEITALDSQLIAWLADEQLISKGGVIYELPENSTVDDVNENTKHVNHQKFISLLKNKFVKHLKHNNINLRIQEQKYPEPQKDDLDTNADISQYDDGNMKN